MVDYSSSMGSGDSGVDPFVGGTSEGFSAADEKNLRQLLNLTSAVPYYDDYDYYSDYF